MRWLPAGAVVLATACEPIIVTPSRDAAADVQPAADAPPVEVPPPGETFCGATPDDMPAGVRAPEGFCVRRYARVRMPRVLAFAPNGDVFVASPSLVAPGGSGPGQGAILVLPDDDGDGVADGARAFLTGVASVHGLAFDGASLVYTLHESVRRVPYAPGDRAARAPAGEHELVADLAGSARWTHGLARDRGGALYVSVGQYDRNDCPARSPDRGAVLRVGGGAPREGDPFVTGLRNPMYLRCEAWGDCYAMELTHDAWDAYGATEKLLRLRRGDDYAFPCCVDRGVTWPGTPRGEDCRRVPEPELRIPKHDVPFGFGWAPASWPAPYGGAFFVAQHGAVGSWANTGVRWAPADPATHRPTRAVAPFIEGWGRRGAVVGRTADLAFAPDGRMFFTDDEGGAVYWAAPRSLRRPRP